MRKLTFLLFAIAAVTFAGISCEDKNGGDTTKEFGIDLVENELEFTAADDKIATVNVKAVNVSWSTSKDRDWIIVEEGSSKFTVSVKAFDSYEESRDGVVTVSANGFDPIKIDITQTGKVASIDISPALGVQFPSFFYPTDPDENKQRSVTVTTNVPEWSVEIPEEDKWLTQVSKNANTLVLTATDNQYAERSSEVAIIAGSLRKTFKVTQLTALVPYEKLGGAYTATGTPAVWNGTTNEGPSSWQTTFAGATNEDGPYYLTKNYGGRDIAMEGKANIYLEWLHGRPTIYSPKELGFKSSGSGLDAYQIMFIIKEDGKPYIIVGSQDGVWDESTGTVDFSGKNSLGYDIIIGMVAMEYVAGTPMIRGNFTEGYKNLKFKSNGTQQVPASITKNAHSVEGRVEPELRLMEMHPDQKKMSELPILKY